MKAIIGLRESGIPVLWGGQFLAIAGLTVLVPLLPLYMTELGANDPGDNRLWTGLSLAAPAVTACFVSPVWGKAGDRLGRKWMVVRALLGLAASLILMGAAQTPFQFFLCRLLQGVCGGVVDAASAYAGSEAPETERGKALGIMQSAIAAGSLAGPLVGGVMVNWIGFSSLLVFMGILTGMSGLLAAAVLKETGKKEDRKKTEASVTQVYIDLLSHSRLRPFMIAGVFSQIGMFGLVVVFAPFVAQLSGISGNASAWVGILQAIAWGAGLAGAAWWGKRNDRSRIETNLILAMAVCGISIILQAMPQHVLWLIPLRIVQGFCYSSVLQSIMLAVTQESKDEHRGVYVGTANSVLVFGQIAGSLTGAMLGGFLTGEWIIAVMGLMFLTGAFSIVRGHALQPGIFKLQRYREVNNER
ncbi:MFS transporter [Paenibacillus alkalitolerans]|uniref:MFS transporter n=1 Tax=Paenibacillus alkalitolerans TaxID=2799335 RepID=UPI0018F6DBE8|nr:MFS transporter [Paenibacillus alkalitolerans]